MLSGNKSNQERVMTKEDFEYIRETLVSTELELSLCLDEQDREQVLDDFYQSVKAVFGNEHKG